MAVLGYLGKLKRGLGLASGTAWFFHNNVPYSIPYQSMDKVSMSHLISFSRYQTKCDIKFLFRQLMSSWTLRFFLRSTSKAMVDSEKKREDKNTKIWMSREWKELFRSNKSIFHSFWRPIILWKIKIWQKIADTSLYEFWHDYVKLKYGENAELSYMDTDSFIFYVKTEDIYKEITKDVDVRFGTSNFERGRPLPKR